MLEQSRAVFHKIMEIFLNRRRISLALLALSALFGCAPSDKSDQSISTSETSPEDELIGNSESKVTRSSPCRYVPKELRGISAPESWAPETVEELFRSARIEALQLVEECGAIPDSLEVQARIEFATGNYLDAQKIWKCQIEQDPVYAFGHHGLGLIAKQNGRFDEAASYHLRAVEIMPTMIDAVHEASTALMKVGKLDEAIDVLRSSLKRNESDTKGIVILAQAYLAKRDYQQARRYFELALNRSPEVPEALYGLAIALARLNLEDEARDVRKQCVELRKRQRSREKKHRRNRSDFAENAKRISSQLVQAANVYRSQQLFDESMKILRYATQLDQNNIAAWKQLCELLLTAGQIEEAESAYAELTQIEPEAGSHWLNLGRVRFELGEIAGAREAFLSVLKINDRFDVGHYWLARCDLALQDHESALASIQEAMQFETKPEYHALHAEILAATGKTDAAINAVELAIRQAPGRIEYLKLRNRIRDGEK